MREDLVPAARCRAGRGAWLPVQQMNSGILWPDATSRDRPADPWVSPPPTAHSGMSMSEINNLVGTGQMDGVPVQHRTLAYMLVNIFAAQQRGVERSCAAARGDLSAADHIDHTICALRAFASLPPQQLLEAISVTSRVSEGRWSTCFHVSATRGRGPGQSVHLAASAGGGLQRQNFDGRGSDRAPGAAGNHGPGRTTSLS